jgi:hypothetical protein
MSDQGERGARWTEMNDDTTVTDDPTGPHQQVHGAGQAEGQGVGPPARAVRPASVGFAELPEVEVPAPAGRTEFSDAPQFGLTESPSLDDLPDDDWRLAERPAGGAHGAGSGPMAEAAGSGSESVPVSSWFERPAKPAEPQDEREERNGLPAGWNEPAGQPVFAAEPMDGGSTGPLPEAPEGFRIEAPVEPPAGFQAEPPADSWSEPPTGASGGQPAGEPDDVRVAPVPADEHGRPGGERSGWEGSLFDGPGEEESVPGYAPVDMSGPGGPPKPGKPSSGNWQMPDWIHEEEQQARQGGGTSADADFDEGGRSRVALFAGVGVLVVALAAAGGVFYLKRDGNSAPTPRTPSAPPTTQGLPASNDTTPKPQVNLPPDKAMPRFSGRPSRAVGMVADRRSGLAYPRFAAPWQLPTKKNKLGVAGWSGQQVVVTERSGNRIWYGQLLTGVLQPSLAERVEGARSLKPVTAMALDGLIERYYAFPHKERPLASQPLTIGGRKGWLVSSYLTYKRPGIKATGEVVTVAVIDTGRAAPAVVFASVPNTHRKLWPDVNAFFDRLKLAGNPTE